ncbi:hypothetical protein BDZ89DRAFT_1037982 [Hymenopellis radicata]|nr:hypothetical protein BDZ89DRAFT_1037982 [Hymenopellis radicata]
MYWYHHPKMPKLEDENTRPITHKVDMPGFAIVGGNKLILRFFFDGSLSLFVSPPTTEVAREAGFCREVDADGGFCREPIAVDAEGSFCRELGSEEAHTLAVGSHSLPPLRALRLGRAPFFDLLSTPCLLSNPRDPPPEGSPEEREPAAKLRSGNLARRRLASEIPSRPRTSHLDATTLNERLNSLATEAFARVCRRDSKWERLSTLCESVTVTTLNDGRNTPLKLIRFAGEDSTPEGSREPMRASGEGRCSLLVASREDDRQHHEASRLLRLDNHQNGCDRLTVCAEMPTLDHLRASVRITS